MTVREGCGYDIQLEASCYNPAYVDGQPRVFINEARWVRGAVPFQGDVGSYRQYLINHEVGHAMGYQRHEGCAENGALAPIMMQQTFYHRQQRRGEVRPGIRQARRQDLPVQPVAVPHRLSHSSRVTRRSSGSYARHTPLWEVPILVGERAIKEISVSTSLPPLVEPGGELTREEVARYSRHLIIPDLGWTGRSG